VVDSCKINKPSEIKDQKSNLHSTGTDLNIKISLAVAKAKPFSRTGKLFAG